MQLVIKFTKRGEDDADAYVREKTITMKSFGVQHFNWHEAVAAAIFHAQPGERIVALFEEEYR